MNEKASQRASARKSWWQRHRSKQSNLAKQNGAIRFLLLNSFWNRRNTRRVFSLFIKDHRSSLLTAILGAMLFCLLLGIASQLPFPAANAALTGENSVSYSSFVQQIRVHTIVAVVFRGDSAHALLRPTSSQEATSAIQNITGTPEYTSWYRSVSSNTSLQGAYTAQTGRFTAIYTNVPGESKAFLVAMLTSKNIHIDTLPALSPPRWLAVVSRVLPLLFLLVLLMVFLRLQRRRHPLSNLGDRIKQMGKSRARRFEHAKEVVSAPQKPSKRSKTTKTTMTSTSVHEEAKVTARVNSIPDVNFHDVAGIDEVRTELQEIVYFLKDAERYRRLGARIPRGALLVGAPGTGKTLLARAVAGEANVPFFCISASEFVEMFVGVGASRVRNLFSDAKQVAPAVIFIDEIDAVGRSRSIRINSNDEREQTLNQLLVEMDGFHSHEAIVVLAATNRVDILDKALLRPGRFDRHIVVSAPDQMGREAILRVHTRNTPLHTGVDLTTLARLTTGMTGADLANLVNEAALIAARENQESVTGQCFEDALARMQLGALRPIVMSEKERHIIAVHEGGHALVAHYLPEADLVNRVTILPRGQSLGVTQFTSEADRYNYSREMLMTRIAVGLGGRVAEELVFGCGRVTTGAENDFQTVTDIARRMVTRWGMSKKVGVMFAEAHTENAAALHFQRVDGAHTQALVLKEDGTAQVSSRPLSSSFFASMPIALRDTRGSMSAIIDAEVQCILHEAYTTARMLLSEHREELSGVVDALMMQEQLDRNQFLALLG